MENVQNPLMAKIKLPGRTFELPSKGAMYKNGELSNTTGEIHVHAMSALSEISLKNPDLLFNGKALNTVFAECVPEVKQVSELYGRDIDAIMYFLRLVTYGPIFEIDVEHNCEGAKSHSYTVNIEEMVTNMKKVDPTTIDKILTVVLPNQQVVKTHPVRFQQMIELYQMNAGKTEFTEEDIKKNIVFNLTSIIESVDDVTKKEFIEEWVRGLTTPYQNLITESIEKANDWGPARTVKLTCRDCQKEMEVELPLNPISFFTE